MQPFRQPLRRSRNGFTATEAVVASTLLLTAITVVSSLAVHTMRLWMGSRHQQLALEELTGELERLVALAPSERITAMESLSPSNAILAAAPQAEITGKTVRDQDGTRIVLSLQWNRKDIPTAPLQLVAWLDPMGLDPMTTEDSP